MSITDIEKHVNKFLRDHFEEGYTVHKKYQFRACGTGIDYEIVKQGEFLKEITFKVYDADRKEFKKAIVRQFKGVLSLRMALEEFLEELTVLRSESSNMHNKIDFKALEQLCDEKFKEELLLNKISASECPFTPNYSDQKIEVSISYLSSTPSKAIIKVVEKLSGFTLTFSSDVKDSIELIDFVDRTLSTIYIVF